MGAIVLEFLRQRWGSESWYPIAVGIDAVLAIIPLRLLLSQHIEDRTTSNWGRFAFFLIGGSFPFLGFRFLGRKDLFLLGGLMVMSGLCLWTAFGTLFQWPGFLPPPDPDE